MRRLLPLSLLFLAGCGGSSVSTRDGTAALFFSDETEFAPSTIALTSYDRLEGSREDDGLDVYFKEGGRTLEIYLPSGSTTSLDTDLRASVIYHDIFGDATGVAGTVTVLENSRRKISLSLSDVVLQDDDGEGEATLSGPVTVKNLVDSDSRAVAHPARRKGEP